MNNPKPNYFYVNRNLLHSDRWLSEPFTRGQAWVDLFGLAQHCNSFFRIRGIRIEVKRGQLAYSQKTLASRWRWSRNKIIRYLKELENQGDIEQQNSNLTTLITIIKYDLWQGNGTPNGTPDGTPEGHQKDTRRDTYNNVKNDKNEKNTTTDGHPSPINYLLNIPTTDLLSFSGRFIATEKEIRSKAESLYLYCKSKGRQYKNYKAFLLNALKKDFRERPEAKKPFIIKPTGEKIYESN